MRLQSLSEDTKGAIVRLYEKTQDAEMVADAFDLTAADVITLYMFQKRRPEPRVFAMKAKTA